MNNPYLPRSKITNDPTQDPLEVQLKPAYIIETNGQKFRAVREESNLFITSADTKESLGAVVINNNSPGDILLFRQSPCGSDEPSARQIAFFQRDRDEPGYTITPLEYSIYALHKQTKEHPLDYLVRILADPKRKEQAYDIALAHFPNQHPDQSRNN